MVSKIHGLQGLELYSWLWLSFMVILLRAARPWSTTTRSKDNQEQAKEHEDNKKLAIAINSYIARAQKHARSLESTVGLSRHMGAAEASP